MSRYRITERPWMVEVEGARYNVEVTDCVDTRTGTVYADGAYRVTDARTGKAAKKGKGGTVPFYGETAWNDARRLADDLEILERRYVGF